MKITVNTQQPKLLSTTISEMDIGTVIEYTFDGKFIITGVVYQPQPYTRSKALLRINGACTFEEESNPSRIQIVSILGICDQLIVKGL